jgi:hypothetical protein
MQLHESCLGLGGPVKGRERFHRATTQMHFPRSVTLLPR